MNQVATTTRPEATNAFSRELDDFTPNLMQALPANVSVEKFKRVMVTAVGMNPDLYYANRRTLYLSMVRCAADGLLPDGREAALVVYRTKVKQRDPETGIDREITINAVSYLPMIAGIRKRMRNSGDVLSATAEVVYRGDTFRYRLGDDAMIEHEPPGLGEDRGEPVGAYAIIKLRSGEVLRDVLTMKEIDAARHQGRATNSLMWTKFWSEGAKKTALRRCAKAAPQSAELETLLGREEEPPLLPDHHEPLPALPAAPQREDFTGEIDAEDLEYEIIDSDGAVRSFASGHAALDALRQVLNEAARLGNDRLVGTWDDNQPSIEELERNGFDVSAVVELYGSLSSPPAEGRPRQDVQQPAAPSPPAADAAGDRRVPRHVPPTQAGAAPATNRDALDDLLEPTDEVSASLPAGPGPTAPTPASPSEERQNQAIEMVMTRGEPNYPTWVRARLIPRMRRLQVSDDMAWFMADNDEPIERAKRYPELAREIDGAVAEQWRVIGEIERNG